MAPRLILPVPVEGSERVVELLPVEGSERAVELLPVEGWDLATAPLPLEGNEREVTLPVAPVVPVLGRLPVTLVPPRFLLLKLFPEESRPVD